MSNFIKIPAQEGQDGGLTSECVINLDQVFMIRTHESNEEYRINFMTPTKETFDVVFFENKEERDFWYEKIINLIVSEI